MAHESPKSMTVPLLILAVLSLPVVNVLWFNDTYVKPPPQPHLHAPQHAYLSPIAIQAERVTQPHSLACLKQSQLKKRDTAQMAHTQPTDITDITDPHISSQWSYLSVLQG